jgi:hypothetical protein
MLTLQCCVADLRKKGMAATLLELVITEIDLVDLLGFWKGLRMPNLLRFVGHIMPVLQCKYGVPYCLRSLVMFKRSLGAKLTKIVKNSKSAENAKSAKDAPTAKAWGSHGRHLGCFKSFKTTSFFLNFSELT